MSTPTQNQINSDHYTEIKSIPIHQGEIKPISTTHTTTKSISMSTLEPCHFRPVLFGVFYIRAHVPVIYSSNMYYTNASTNPHCSWRVHAAVKTRGYRVGTSINFYLLHGTCMTTCDTGGRTSLPSIPSVLSISWCHIPGIGPPAVYLMRIMPMQ